MLDWSFCFGSQELGGDKPADLLLPCSSTLWLHPLFVCIVWEHFTSRLTVTLHCHLTDSLGWALFNRSFLNKKPTKKNDWHLKCEIYIILWVPLVMWLKCKSSGTSASAATRRTVRWLSEHSGKPIQALPWACWIKITYSACVPQKPDAWLNTFFLSTCFHSSSKIKALCPQLAATPLDIREEGWGGVEKWGRKCGEEDRLEIREERAGEGWEADTAWTLAFTQVQRLQNTMYNFT